MIAELDGLHARLYDGVSLKVEPDGRLARLAAVFRLSAFERDLLLWCAGAEVDGRFTPPTFGAALSALDDAHWDALAPSAPLRHWRLVEVGAGPGLVSRPLRIDERILHHLIGVPCTDPRLDGVMRVRGEPAGLLTPAQFELAMELVDRPGLVMIEGADEPTRERVAAQIADARGRVPVVVPHDRIPPPGPDNALLARLVEREVALIGGLPLITALGPAPGLLAFLEQLGCPAIVGGTSFAWPDAVCRRIPSPTTAERMHVWRHLPDAAQAAAAFRFEVPELEAIARDAETIGLHQACRQRGRTELSELADHIEPAASWADLVLPESSARALRDIAGQVRNRAKVYDDWGMGATTARGLGITALFTGESGTGKTLAAEVLAAELDLDLYRIDLAAVVSKYIGETEKNLKRVFDSADASGAVLLFDEADAIFGKRSEVRDSHDRYANLEISYLLQRMETYRGLAILTTNLRGALDKAFLRRLRFVVPFPFPDATARARIWRLMLGPKVPVSDLDFERLGRLQLSGGNIRTVAHNSAFLAASAGDPVTMAHVLAAARREYAKLEKPLTEAEIGGWA